MSKWQGDDDALFINTPHHQKMRIQPGSVVIIKDADQGDHFGAAIHEIEGVIAHLTFVPAGRPASVPILNIVTAATTLINNPESLPTQQPAPTTRPKKRRLRRGEQPEVAHPATLDENAVHYL